MNNKNLTTKSRLLIAAIVASSLSITANTQAAQPHVNGASFVKTSPVKAQVKSDSFLHRLVQKADLIVYGELVDISEVLSVENIPYTFATYHVNQVVAGRFQQNTITFKYVGGEFANGNRLTASNSPKITLGEQAILMLQHSKDTGCDLVECENGRFVIANDSVVAANEAALSVNEHGDLNYIPLTLKNPEGSVVSKGNVGRFISYIQKLDKAMASDVKKQLGLVKSLDINMPFNAYAGLTQAHKAPPMGKVTPAITKSTANKSQFDLWEEQQVKRNGGDPLLSSPQK